MSEQHPFFARRYGGRVTYHVDAESRLDCVKTFTREQCDAALRLTALQKTVRDAIFRRLRKLAKETA